MWYPSTRNSIGPRNIGPSREIRDLTDLLDEFPEKVLQLVILIIRHPGIEDRHRDIDHRERSRISGAEGGRDSVTVDACFRHVFTVHDIIVGNI